MLITRFLYFIVFFAFECLAVTIAIKGTVKDNLGNGLAGATIKLKSAGITATSDQNGTFILSGTLESRRIDQQIHVPKVTFFKNKFNIQFDNKTEVSISVVDLLGKGHYHIPKIQIQGIASFKLPVLEDGIYIVAVNTFSFETIYKVIVFNRDASIVTLQKEIEKSVVSRTAAKQVNDIILVNAEGYLNYSMQINKYIDSLNVKLLPSAGDVVDIDGNIYQCVKIGNQIWTVENYRSTRFNDGKPIRNVISAEEWMSTTPGYCYYNNTSNIENIKTYGAIYNYYAAISPELPPKGWHVPKITDFDTLKAYLVANDYYFDSYDKLSIAKSMASKTYWTPPSTQGQVGNDLSKNNQCGFNAQPAGFRYSNGKFAELFDKTHFWSTTASTTKYSIAMCLQYNDSRFRLYNYENTCGMSIRLIKD